VRSFLANHLKLAIILAVLLALVAGIGLGALLFGAEGQRAAPVPTGQPSATQEGHQNSREREEGDGQGSGIGRDKAEGGSGTGRTRSGEGARLGREQTTDRSSASTPPQPSGGASRGSKILVPDELIGQEGEVSKEDLRLSDLRGQVRGPADAFVCAADPPEGSVVTKGSTVILLTRC